MMCVWQTQDSGRIIQGRLVCGHSPGTADRFPCAATEKEVQMDTVLVIEDSRPMQRTLQRLFESDALEVQIASDGQAGLESFRKQTPSVVVLDLKLPRLSG